MRGVPRASDIDAYIAAAPKAVQPLLRRMRTTIAKAAPDATEAIAYGMPTFRLNGNLVHFAAFARHIGFYPGPGAIEAHADELTPYHTSKGAIQFPLDAPLPLPLVAKITAFRVQQCVATAATGVATRTAARRGTVHDSATKKTGAQKTAAQKTAAQKTRRRDA